MATFSNKRNVSQNEKNHIQNIIIRVAREEGIDPVIALALAQQESSFNYLAIGDGGKSTGLFQINSKAHPDYKRLDNPEYQARYAMRFLKGLLQKHNGDLYKAIRSYNGSGKMATDYANLFFSTNLPKFDREKKYGRGSQIAASAYNKRSDYDFSNATGNVLNAQKYADRTALLASIDTYLARKYGKNYVFDASTMQAFDLDGNVLETSESLAKKGFSPKKYTHNEAVLNYLAADYIRQAGGDPSDPEAMDRVKNFILSGDKTDLGLDADMEFEQAEDEWSAPQLAKEQAQHRFDHVAGSFTLADVDNYPTSNYSHLDAVARFSSNDPTAMYNDAMATITPSVDRYIDEYLMQARG